MKVVYDVRVFRLFQMSLAVALVLLVWIAFSALESPQNRDSCLRVSQQFIDLGVGQPGQLMRGEFEVINTGSEKIHFEISTSCGCTSLSPRKGDLNTKEKELVRFSVRLPTDQHNSKKTVRLTIYPKNTHIAPVVCVVTAECLCPITATPSRIDRIFCSKSELNHCRFKFRISPTNLEEMTLKFDQFRVDFDHNLFQLNESSVAEGVVHLGFIVNASSSRDRLNSIVRVTHINSSQEITLPVNLMYEHPLVLFPGVVKLQKSPSGNIEDFRVIIVNRIPEQELGEVSLRTTIEGLRILKQTDLGLNKKLIQLEVSALAARSDTIPIEFYCCGIDSIVSCTLVPPQPKLGL